MTRATFGDIFVSRVRFLAASVARDDFLNAWHPFKITFDASETSTRDGQNLCACRLGGLGMHGEADGDKSGENSRFDLL